MKNLLIVFILVSFITIAGCGKKEENTAGNKDTATVVIPQENTTITTKPDSTIKQGNSDLGLKNEMPSDFPKDVPHPPNSVHKGVIYSQTDGNAVTFVSKSKPLEIAAFYKEELKKAGFVLEESGDELVNEKGGMLKWSKAPLTVELMMSWKENEKESDVVISYKK